MSKDLYTEAQEDVKKLQGSYRVIAHEVRDKVRGEQSSKEALNSE